MHYAVLLLYYKAIENAQWHTIDPDWYSPLPWFTGKVYTVSANEIICYDYMMSS